jgi:hypothetical protein
VNKTKLRVAVAAERWVCKFEHLDALDISMFTFEASPYFCDLLIGRHATGIAG